MEVEGGVDFVRLERGLGLQARKVDNGRYHVTGGASDHWVDILPDAAPHCDCGDYLWRERICKHILAALLREGNEEVVRAVGGLVASLRTQTSHVPAAA